MKAGLVLLGLAYVLSQFFRAFLAVLSPFLRTDIGTSPDDLALASGLWFLSFAAMQLPIGWALDTLGPRRTTAVLLALGGGGGAAVFALATGPAHINFAMILIGIGCAPVLMASYYIFARQFPPARFVVLASIMVGVGTSGNLVASYPTALAAETMGWRAALWGLAAMTTVTAVGIWFLVRDPPTPEGEANGSFLAVLRIRALWPIFPLMLVSYALVGALRGLWIGPYLEDIFGADARSIGWATLAMGVAMIAGTLTYGPLDRIFGTRKWVIFIGSLGTLIATATLIALPATSFILSAALMCMIGFFGATYAPIMAHGRSFLPPALVGRGMTLLNLCGIGGVGLMQFASGRVYTASLGTGSAVLPYTMIFAFSAGLLILGLVAYLFAQDTQD
ncbi:MFS transporter [Sulfitobacter sp. SK012]|uniref:MFS transporter n=1 Tax=Sulfitobacter sp. SK012 TaxID=1389005 RepID=UPI000E0BD5AD|nr:MFS transporter [Sulfitobacter sp. SK012]AXI44872.1 MFS transporter [Sulfitobacter sp. SK012]